MSSNYFRYKTQKVEWHHFSCCCLTFLLQFDFCIFSCHEDQTSTKANHWSTLAERLKLPVQHTLTTNIASKLTANLFVWHFSSWWCSIIPNLVTKGLLSSWTKQSSLFTGYSSLWWHTMKLSLIAAGISSSEKIIETIILISPYSHCEHEYGKQSLAWHSNPWWCTIMQS